MFKIDKRSDDQERNKNPVRNGRLPRKPLPDHQKQNCGNQFHREIAERNSCSAIAAPAAERKPTDQRQIVMPWDRPFALRTKRPTRLINREIDRPPVDADIQKRADRRSEHEGEHAEKEILSGMLHVVNWRSFWMRGVPSATQSRCSFHIADTSEAPWRSKSEYQASA